MKLAYVDLCGFRGYQKQLCIQFPDGFIVIDGRNGVGKSTIFDARWTPKMRQVTKVEPCP